ncbi:MAG: zeta toxin family protein [Deltaproteobacteria bacterium]|nr:zeta toxin family protein [Deltaproteobacteria bacterium]
MRNKPQVLVLGGPNGAGKSTLAPALVMDRIGLGAYLDADTIARGLAAFDPAEPAIEAGRVMLRRIQQLRRDRQDFAVESTLSGRSLAETLRSLRSEGYAVHLVYLWLSSPEESIRRVRARVAAGGHGVPEPALRRRHPRSVRNLFDIYMPLADTWYLFDNSASEPTLAAYRISPDEPHVVELEKWRIMKGGRDA